MGLRESAEEAVNYIKSQIQVEGADMATGWYTTNPCFEGEPTAADISAEMAQEYENAVILANLLAGARTWHNEAGFRAAYKIAHKIMVEGDFSPQETCSMLMQVHNIIGSDVLYPFKFKL